MKTNHDHELEEDHQILPITMQKFASQDCLSLTQVCLVKMICAWCVMTHFHVLYELLIVFFAVQFLY